MDGLDRIIRYLSEGIARQTTRREALVDVSKTIFGTLAAFSILEVAHPARG